MTGIVAVGGVLLKLVYHKRHRHIDVLARLVLQSFSE